MRDKIHLIVDFQYLYYRAFFGLKSGKLNRLSYLVDGEEIDTSEMYYVMCNIESFRKQFQDSCKELTVSICFDSRSKRKSQDSEYKENRDEKPKENKLTDEDHNKILKVLELCKDMGYNVYKEEGYEADDLVASLIKDYKDEYDYNVIYTTDKDLLVNICDNVGIMRYKTNLRNHIAIDKSRYQTLVSKEFKCNIPYNAIGLYLSLVGDSSDNIKGAKGFGPKAFDTFISHLQSRNVNFEALSDYDEVEKVIKENLDLLNTTKRPNTASEALHSLGLVRTMYLNLEKPVKKDTEQSRVEALHRYGFRLDD